MKKFVKLLLLLTLIVLQVGCQSQAKEEPNPNAKEVDVVRSQSTVKKDEKSGQILTSQQSYQIGTYITIGIYDKEQVPDEVFDKVFGLIDDYDQLLSTSILNSQVDIINQNAGKKPVAVDESVFSLIMKGIEYGEISTGLFDISIGPLVKLWGIGSDSAQLPADEEITAIKNKVNYKNITMDVSEKSVYLENAGMIMDLGGIAKGYIADRIKEEVLLLGYTSCIINLGGNVLMVGEKPNGEPWAVGIRDPQGEENVGILRIGAKSVVSSGVYERFFIENGVRYHHIIHPTKGYPEQNDMLSVTILSEASVDGDALSTALFLMGLEKGFQWALENKDIEAVFVMANGDVYATPGVENELIITNGNYVLKSYP